MKNFIRSSFVCAALTLGGCVGTNPSDIIAQIQAYTAQVCAFEPTAASVAAVISAIYPAAGAAVGVVNVVGNAICNAPTTKGSSLRRGGAATRVVQTPKGPVAVSGKRL